MSSTTRSAAARAPAPRAPAARSRLAAFAPLRRQGSIRWNRVGRAALLLVLGVIVLLYIPPVTHWIEQSRTASIGREQLEQLERENRALEARLDALRGPASIEREARRLGMVRAGERAISVRGLPGD